MDHGPGASMPIAKTLAQTSMEFFRTRRLPLDKRVWELFKHEPYAMLMGRNAYG